MTTINALVSDSGMECIISVGDYIVYVVTSGIIIVDSLKLSVGSNDIITASHSLMNVKTSSQILRLLNCIHITIRWNDSIQDLMYRVTSKHQGSKYIHHNETIDCDIVDIGQFVSLNMY